MTISTKTQHSITEQTEIIRAGAVLGILLTDKQWTFGQNNTRGGKDVVHYMRYLKQRGVVEFEDPGDWTGDPVASFLLGPQAKAYYNEEVPKALLSLQDTLTELDQEYNRRLAHVTGHDVAGMRAQLESLASKARELRSSAAKQPAFAGLQTDIAAVERSINDLLSLNVTYEAAYLTLIKPIQIESVRGIRTTVIWAVVGILLTAMVSIAISIFV